MPREAWDHRADDAQRAADDTEAILERVRNAFKSKYLITGYTSFLPWSKAIGIDGDGDEILLNTRKLHVFSPVDYAGTIVHELAHKAGYSHKGNKRAGNTCTVPHLIADIAEMVAAELTTGKPQQPPSDACPGFLNVYGSLPAD
ncbi:hypothetical protein [Sorangium sp. So ce1097]|uniref:hypothetical protein n=1 Tax=Sorangium sp. So ce1097 TaxID=3133330 RepID=UPI003F5DDC88